MRITDPVAGIDESELATCQVGPRIPLQFNQQRLGPILQPDFHADDMSIQTFALSEQASAKMQQAIDKGGYQWGDKVTVLYDPTSRKAVKIKGKPSRPS